MEAQFDEVSLSTLHIKEIINDYCDGGVCVSQQDAGLLVFEGV